MRHGAPESLPVPHQCAVPTPVSTPFLECWGHSS